MPSSRNLAQRCLLTAAIAVLSLPLSIASEVSYTNAQMNQGITPDQQLATAANSKNKNLAALQIATWADTTTAVDQKQVADVLKCTKLLGAPKVAQIIAISPQWRMLIGELLKFPPSRALASSVLAARGTMTLLDDIKIAALEAMAPEGDWRVNVRRHHGGGEGGAATVEGRRWRRAQGGLAGTEPGPPDVEWLIDLIADRNEVIQAYAVVAAAGFGLNDPQLVESMNAISADSGVIPGAKLLYLARIGAALPVDLVESAFSARKQPRLIAGVSPALGSVDTLVPSAALGCLAIGISKNTEHIDVLHDALEDRDVRVRIEAARALVAIADRASLPLMIDLLPTKDWPVLIEVCEYLGRVRSLDAVEPLIARLDKEEGRFRRNIIYALSSISGNQYGRQTAEQWTAWWTKAQADGWQINEGESAAYRAKYRLQDVSLQGFGSFYGIDIDSSRFSFVLDTSMSMQGDRIRDLKSHATDVIKKLPRNVKYNIVDFGGRVSLMYDGGLVNDRGMALDTIEYAELTFYTRTYDALEVAFDLNGLDSVYLLSDGAPWNSQVAEWNEIMTVANLTMRYRPLAIHTVCFMAGPANAGFMHQLADEHFGQSTNIE